MQKFLLATDGSETEQLIRQVHSLMETWPSATLLMVYVTRVEGNRYAAIPVHYEDDLARRLEEDSKHQHFPQWQHRIEFQHHHGHPARKICEVAKQQDVDLIVIGSHRKGAVDRLLLGSVSQAVVNHSPVPVLVVKE